MDYRANVLAFLFLKDLIFVFLTLKLAFDLADDLKTPN